jgi:hypothetical protein
MRGPFILTDEEVNNRVEIGKMGNYAYGYLQEREGRQIFIVRYVGRSTTDLREEIKSRHKSEKKFTPLDCEYFKFSYADSVRDAYEKECQNFHDFGEEQSLLNEVHPAKPNDNGSYRCPIEGCKR